MTANLSQRRSHAREGAKRIEATITAALDELEAARAADRDAARTRRKAEQATRGTITHAAVLAAIQGAPSGVAVRDDTGWHPLLRLNTTTVTVPGPWGGTRRIRIDQLHGIHA